LDKNGFSRPAANQKKIRIDIRGVQETSPSLANPDAQPSFFIVDLPKFHLAGNVKRKMLTKMPTVVGQFDPVAAIPQGGLVKWRRKAASTSN